METYPLLWEEQAQHGDASFPCAVYHAETGHNSVEKIYCHWHKELELLYVTKGHGILHIGKKRYPIQEGAFALIPSNTTHMVTGDPSIPFCFIAIVFHPDFIRSFDMDAVQEQYVNPCIQWRFHISPVISQNIAYQKLIFQISTAYQNKNNGFELAIKVSLLSICLMLYQDFHLFLQADVNTQDTPTLIKQMILYLQENFTESISLDEMAHAFHISKSYLCSYFKEMTNTSPITYLNHFRINKSIQLLCTTDLDISIIACRCGFNTISYFNRIFRRYMHTTPREYRKNAKKEN